VRFVGTNFFCYDEAAFVGADRFKDDGFKFYILLVFLILKKRKMAKCYFLGEEG
jgi:hypothetical protein